MTILLFLGMRGLYDIRGRFLVMPWTILLCDETYEYASFYLDAIWYGNAIGKEVLHRSWSYNGNVMIT